VRVLTRPLAAMIATFVASVPILAVVAAPAHAAAAVTITTPVNGSTTDDWTPAINGTSNVVSGSVTVAVDSRPAVTVPTNTAGDWSLPATPTNLAQGSHTALATATDGVGNRATDSTTFIVDNTSLRPQLFISTPPNESATSDSTPAVTGTSDIISGTITVAFDDGPQISVHTNSTGGWTMTPPTLTDGQHVAVARASNADAATETMTNFLVDSTPPALAISTPANGSTTDDPTPRVSGTSDFATIRGTSHSGTVTVTIDGGAPVRLTSGTTGAWSLTPTTALRSGKHVIVAKVVDAFANASTATTHFTVSASAVGVSHPARSTQVGTPGGANTGSVVSPSARPSLANTGSEPRPLIALALLLLLTGATATRLGGIQA
jgi:Bacterial Ig-like domain